MRLRLFLLILIIASSCYDTLQEKPNYFAFAKSRKLAEITSEELEEVSGLAPSLKNPNFLWTHNDSGNKPEVYLVNDSLSIKLTCKLKGVENRDWEDIAVGPGPDSSKTYVYVGEIGDNVGRYNYKMIYRFEEPDLQNIDTTYVEIENFDTITFELPDERKDTETLLVDPSSRDLFVISKRERPVSVYRIVNKPSTALVAEKVATFDREYIVGGTISPDGRELLLKNIDNVYYWKLAADERVQDVFKREPKVLVYKKESQGEAIAFKYDGSGYYTLSELISGEKSFLRFYPRNKDGIQLTGEKAN